jgi:hypothetical protein
MDEFIAQRNDEHLSILHRATPGWIEVIAGSMFSGKSEELIRRLRRAKIARQRVQVFKPHIDTRYSLDHIVSHSEMRHESGVVERAADILEQSKRTPMSSASTKGNSSITILSRSPTNWRGAACASSSPDSIRTTPDAPSSRCRNS